MDALVAHSRQSIEKGSRSFRLASRLFPPRLRDDVWLLYAWCRHCDDEIDGQDHGFAGPRVLDAEERRRRLDRLRRLTLDALAGAPADDPAFAAFSRVAQVHRIGPDWPLELLDGFAMDVEHAQYPGIEDTLLYCWGVAGTVGVMMAQIMGAQAPQTLQRAQDLGLAFQLTNIVRDIVEDAATGRVYLPQSWLADAGVSASPDAVAAEANRTAVYRVAVRALDLAEAYYGSARVGLRDLPFRSALAIATARGVYRAIGRKVRRRGPAGLASRAQVAKPLLIWLLAQSVSLALFSRLERLGPAPPRAALWSRL